MAPNSIPVAASQRVATHCFILFAEDWHGHSGEEHHVLGLRRGELSRKKEKRTESSESIVWRTQSHPCGLPLKCHLPTGGKSHM